MGVAAEARLKGCITKYTKVVFLSRTWPELPKNEESATATQIQYYLLYNTRNAVQLEYKYRYYDKAV